MATPKISNRMPRAGRRNPGRKHLSGADVTAKMQRQYEDILQALRQRRKYRSDAKRKQVAAATVRKMAQNPDAQAYRGYLMRQTLHGISITKDGHHIAWAQSFTEARKAIDGLTRNPSWFELDDESRVEQLAEEFHGRPARDFLEVEEKELYDEYGAVLGYLEKLCVLMEDDTFIPIEFDFDPGGEDNVLVVSDPSGNNIEFIGGDQDINWQDVDGATEDKDIVLVGPVFEIDYFADKHHLSGPQEQKTGITYYHEFGEDDGELPYLVFDRRNTKLWFVGGSYKVEPEGITG